MRKLWFLLMSLSAVALVTAPDAVADPPCSETCENRYSMALYHCGGMYAGDSEGLYQCSQTARAEYDYCMANCLS